MNGWDADEKHELSRKNVSLSKVVENGFFIRRDGVSTRHSHIEQKPDSQQPNGTLKQYNNYSFLFITSVVGTMM